MSKIININRVGGKVVFDSISVTQSTLVVWHNNDSVAHFPVQFCTQTQIGPSGNSDEFPAYPCGPVPTTIFYGCAIPGHEKEKGQINVYADFAPATPTTLPAGAKGKPYPPAGQTAGVAAGGKSPYPQPTITLGSLPPGLLFVVSTSNNGITVAGTPTAAGTFPFTLTATDSLQNSFQQATFTITITD